MTAARDFAGRSSAPSGRNGSRMVANRRAFQGLRKSRDGPWAYGRRERPFRAAKAPKTARNGPRREMVQALAISRISNGKISGLCHFPIVKSPGVGLELPSCAGAQMCSQPDPGRGGVRVARLTEGPCGIIYGGSKPPGRPTQNLSRLTEGRC